MHIDFRKEVGKIEDGEIEPVCGSSHAILHRHVHTQNPERLHQQVQENEDGYVEYKIP